MTVRKILKSLIIIIELTFCSGCMTTGLIREVEHGKPRFDDYSKKVWNGAYLPSGKYSGELSRNGNRYRRYVFDRTTAWPQASNYASMTSLEVLLPMDTAVEPSLAAIFEVGSPRADDSVLYIHTNPNPNLETLPEILASYWENRVPHVIDRTEMYASRGYPTILSLYLTKDGVGSQLMAGRPDGHKYIWEGPYSCTTKPAAYSGAWWSPTSRIMYTGLVLTVPLDVITSPVQIPIAIFNYNLNRGMSPK